MNEILSTVTEVSKRKGVSNIVGQILLLFNKLDLHYEPGHVIPCANNLKERHLCMYVCTTFGYQVTGIVWKAGFIFKIFKLDYIFFNVLPPPPYTHRFIRIFHCSKQCYSWHPHPIQQVRHFGFHLIDRMKISSFQRIPHFGAQVSHRRLNSVNGEGVGTLECTYRLKIAPRWRHCKLEHCLVAGHVISSSTIPVISFSIVLGFVRTSK
jgi:hypothetical protein